MKPLIIARPEPGNSETARKARSMGLKVVASPLFSVIPIDWNINKSIFYDGIFITSANSLRLAGPKLKELQHMLLYAVGSASAHAAREAGFSSIIVGDGDGATLAALAAAHGARTLLHLAGDPFKPVSHPELSMAVVQVYRAVDFAPSTDLSAALAQPSVVLAHSPRAARRLAKLASATADTDLVAISAQTAAAAGQGWKSVSWPDRPSTDAMLALAAPLCRAA